MLTKISQNSRKSSESYKTQEILLTKLVNDYFSGNFRWVFGQFSEILKINRKHWENDSGLVSWNIFFWKIVGIFSVNVQNIFVFVI